MAADAAAPRPTLVVKPPLKVNQANRQRYAAHITRIAREHHLDPALIHAVISVESGYNPRAVSHKGAMGLMQLMPGTASLYGIDDPFDPVANIRGGVRYLRALMQRFRNISLALAAYNAGPEVVVRYRNTIPPYQETRKYVVRVLNFYMHYRQQVQ